MTPALAGFPPAFRNLTFGTGRLGGGHGVPTALHFLRGDGFELPGERSLMAKGIAETGRNGCRGQERGVGPVKGVRMASPAMRHGPGRAPGSPHRPPHGS